MAKDPAFLFYPNDWQGGTMTLSRHLKGCFMDLLIAQFNSGRLSLEAIKIVLAADFGASWPVLSKKFKSDEKGLFFNERLEGEIIKRRAYSESRRQNLSVRKTPHIDTYMGNHMDSHMEIENRNEDGTGFKDRGTGETIKGFPTMPKAVDVGELPEEKINACIELVRITKKQTVTNETVRSIWGVFKVQVLTGKKYYVDEGAVHSHFINWLKTQNFEDGNNKTLSGSGKLGTSKAREDTASKW